MNVSRGYQFSSALGQWEPSFDRRGFVDDSLSLVTWNVWFDDYAFEERTQGLLEELHQQRPDIVALQEVTPALLKTLSKTDWLQKEYTLSEFAPERMGDYGAVLLSRRAPEAVFRLRLPTGMGRYALVSEFSTGQGRLGVAVVHLESLRISAGVRGQQLRQLFDRLEASSAVVLMGDFNFCSTDTDENGRLDSRYLDLWPSMSVDPGYTEDTAINSMRWAHTGQEKQVRYDRVLLRDDHRRWRCESIALLGTHPLGPELFVSDHFGLVARLRAP